MTDNWIRQHPGVYKMSVILAAINLAMFMLCLMIVNPVGMILNGVTFFINALSARWLYYPEKPVIITLNLN